MLGLASAARRLASAVRGTNHHGARVAVFGQQTPVSRVAGVGVHAQCHATGESLDARAIEVANARIAKKSAATTQLDRMDPEIVEQKKESLAQFLESRLHMKRVEAIRTIALNPLLMIYSHEALERKLDWLARQGLTNEAVQKIIRRGPMIFTHSEESLERTKQWILDQGIASSKIPFFFLAAPQLTGLNNKNRNHKVEFLRGVGLGENEIRRALVQSPKLMTITVENMASKVEGVKRLGLTDVDVVKLITLVPQFLALNMDSIQRKLQAIDEMFGEGEAVRLWLSNPRVLMRNTEELRRTFEFLTKIVGMTPDRISGNVHLIMRNVDRLVRPRYEYLTKIQSRDLEGVNWILQPETKFISRHPDYADFLARNLKPK